MKARHFIIGAILMVGVIIMTFELCLKNRKESFETFYDAGIKQTSAIEIYNFESDKMVTITKPDQIEKLMNTLGNLTYTRSSEQYCGTYKYQIDLKANNGDRTMILVLNEYLFNIGSNYYNVNSSIFPLLNKEFDI